VHRGETRAEADGAAGQQHVLHRRHQRLPLRLAAPRPAGHEQVHGSLVQVIGQVDRGALVAAARLGEVGRLRGLHGGRDVGVEGLAIALRHPGAALGIEHGDELPGLPVAAARREAARLADLLHQRERHRIGAQPADRARGADALEQRHVFSEGRDVELHFPISSGFRIMLPFREGESMPPAKTAAELVAEAKASVPTCSAAEAAKRLAADPKLVLADLREPSEYAQGRIARAVAAPRGVLEFQIEKLAPDRRQPILLHCASGGRAALAVRSLADLGYENVTAVIGPFEELKRAVEG
jgi:rhodanese-related sulfurtransferase